MGEKVSEYFALSLSLSFSLPPPPRSPPSTQRTKWTVCLVGLFNQPVKKKEGHDYESDILNSEHGRAAQARYRYA